MKKCFYTSNGNYECNYNIENFDTASLNNKNSNKELIMNLTNVSKEVCESSVNYTESQFKNVIQQLRNNCNNENFLKEFNQAADDLDISNSIDDTASKEADMALEYMININNSENIINENQKKNIKKNLLETWTPAIKKCKLACYDNSVLIDSIKNNKKPVWNENKRNECENTIVNVSILKNENKLISFPQYEYKCTDFLNIK
jgi:hypothetical protein